VLHHKSPVLTLPTSRHKKSFKQPHKHHKSNSYLAIWPPQIKQLYSYLADDFHLAGRSHPGSLSAASMMLDIPRTTSLGDRAFAIAGPRVWNSLPPAIRDPSLSLSVFGKLLKTYLFV